MAQFQICKHHVVKKLTYMKGFPDGPVVGTQDSHCHWPGLIPGWGTKIPQPTQYSQKYIKISICDM